MKPTERTTVRYVAYGAYALGSAGAAASVGGTWGWAVVVIAGALPGIAMMRYELDERSVRRDRANGWGKSHAPAASKEQGPAPEPLGAMPPEVPPAY